MIGQQSVSAIIYTLGLLPLLIIFAGPAHIIVKLLIIVSLIFSFFAFIWVNYLISYNRLGPLINRIKPEEDVVWIRISKNKLLTFQVAKKGVYGQTKGMIHGQKADVIDKGDFPIRLINGNSAIVVYDLMSHNVNVEHAVAWKQLFKKQKVSTGRDAYLKAIKTVKEAT